MQSQGRFNRVPVKVPVKVWEVIGGKPRQVQRVPEKVAEKEVLGIFGAGPGQVQQVQQRVSSAWVRGTLRRDLYIIKNTTSRLLGKAYFCFSPA